MLEILLPIFCAVLLAYLTYILVRAYRPDLFRKSIVSSPGSALNSGSAPSSGSVDKSAVVEPFAGNAMGPPSASPLNTPSQPIPSAAPPTRGYQSVEPPRVVAPGGPGAPNMQDTRARATLSPEVQAIDPFEDSNMEAPIKDSMRHPELSFGPGMDNSGVKKAVASGVMHKGALSSESPFSPEFAQNGGQFMGDVTANDLSHDDTYATA